MRRKRLRLSILVLLALPMYLYFAAGAASAASVGTADGTYDFGAALGADDSGGSGFATLGDKFLVSNGFDHDGTRLWSANQQEPNTTGTLTIKAEGTNICKSFTFNNLGISAYDSAEYLQSISVSLYAPNGQLITTLGSSDLPLTTLGTDVVQLSSLLNKGIPFSYNNVASITINWKFRNSAAPSNLNIENISISKVVGTSTMTPTSAAFDKYASSADYRDVTTTVTWRGNTLSSVQNGNVTLVAGTDYAVTGDTVAVRKEYLSTQPVGTTNLTFRFSGGTILPLAITIRDTTPPPTYTIAPIADETFQALTVGYETGTQESKTITVSRTGTGDLAHLTAAISGANASNFIVTQPQNTALNGTVPSTTFTVTPKDGLTEGTYTATVTLTADQMTPVSFTVTQVVKPAPDTTAPVTAYTFSPVLSANGQYIAGLTAVFTATDSGSGVAKTEYRINGGAWVTYAVPFTFYADSTETLEWHSIDLAGNAEGIWVMDFNQGTLIQQS